MSEDASDDAWTFRRGCHGTMQGRLLGSWANVDSSCRTRTDSSLASPKEGGMTSVRTAVLASLQSHSGGLDPVPADGHQPSLTNRIITVGPVRQDGVVTKPAAPSRRQWLPSALPVFFGEEPEVTDPWPGLLDVVAKFGALTTEIREEAVQDAEGLGTFGHGLLQTIGESMVTAHSETKDLRSPMRVVLMGRTMAGKSSLLTALTGSHFDRIGDGRQRFSRDVFGAAITASDRIEVVDTPGVGAHGGEDDTEVALKAALDADLIVWVNSSDSIQKESAAALRLLGVIGKPIIVALNCRQSLAGVGRLNLRRFPDRVFGNKDGLVDEIKRHMAAAGVEPLAVVYVHALAAAEALARAEVDAERHSASRVDDLTSALIREQATHSESRRALRWVDGERQQAEELASSLQNGSTTLHAHADRDRSMTDDVHARLSRVLRATGEAMVSDVEAAVGRRRDWHLTASDFGKSLQSDWKDEVSALQEELHKTLESRLTSLATEVNSTIADTDAEWASVSPEQFGLRNLSGFDGVWGNRLIRAGIGIGGTVAALWGGVLLGAKIGGVLGLETGPGAIVTAVVGAVVGGVAGVTIGPIKNLTDRILLGKDGVLRKRRTEVARQVGPLLDDVTQEYAKAVSTQIEEIHDILASERARSEDHSSSLDCLSSRWTHHSEHLRGTIRELDRETTSVLLRIDQRERLARSVKRATRVPGVCVLAEFENSAFWEAWLFPPDLGEKLVGGKAPAPGGEAAGAISYVLGLVDAPASLVRADSTSATLLIHADVPAAITDTWSDALASHIGKHIQIETTRTRNA